MLIKAMEKHPPQLSNLMIYNMFAFAVTVVTWKYIFINSSNIEIASAIEITYKVTCL